MFDELDMDSGWEDACFSPLLTPTHSKQTGNSNSNQQGAIQAPCHTSSSGVPNDACGSGNQNEANAEFWASQLGNSATLDLGVHEEKNETQSGGAAAVNIVPTVQIDLSLEVRISIGIA